MPLLLKELLPVSRSSKTCPSGSRYGRLCSKRSIRAVLGSRSSTAITRESGPREACWFLSAPGPRMRIGATVTRSGSAVESGFCEASSVENACEFKRGDARVCKLRRNAPTLQAAATPKKHSPPRMGGVVRFNDARAISMNGGALPCALRDREGTTEIGHGAGFQTS